MPYFLPTFVMIGAHLLNYYTGNLVVVLFLGHFQMILLHFIYGEETFDNRNIARKNERMFLKDWRFNLPLWSSIFFETATWLWALCLVSDDVKWESHYLTRVKPRTWPQYLIFSFTVGFFTTFSGSAGHELVHKRDWTNKLIGTFSYTQYFYTHFLDEHVQGHHRKLATEDDSATSRLNESVWWFMMRECYMGHANSWNREVKRIRKQHGADASPILLIIKNKMTLYFLIHLSMLAIIYKYLGFSSVKYQFVYTFWGIFFLDVANYFEHYGLQRKRDKNGIHESISKYHSWNNVSTTLYFRLQRHSDHHIASFRPYQILRRWDDVPWCPFSTLSCLWVTMIPPLWYYCMNPRVKALQDYLAGKKEQQDNKISKS